MKWMKLNLTIESLECNKFQVAIFLELLKLDLSVDDIGLSFRDICFVLRDNPMVVQCRVEA